MPTSYTPARSYYSGSTNSKSDLFHIFNVSSDSIQVYTFYIQTRIGFDENLFTVADSTQFFSASLQDRANDTTQAPFVTDITKTNLLKYSDVVALNKFTFTTASGLNANNTYLLPIAAYNINSNVLLLNNLDPNYSYAISGIARGVTSKTLFVDGESSTKNKYSSFYLVRNLDSGTKLRGDHVNAFERSDILVLNTGMDNITSFTDFNLLVAPSVRNFASNITFNADLTRLSGLYSFTYPSQLKLKVTGPATCNVGDKPEYTVTLMNYNFSDTWTSPPNIECYPTTEAGTLSHRKVLLKNGVGKFKVDTTNLYSGDVFDVKVGWKYITNDSKVTVTVS